MTRSVTEIASLHWQPRLNAEREVVEGLDDLAQCLRIILTTPLRSVRHRPEFGCDLLPYVDLPAGEAIPHLIRAATDAIARWETRARVIRITGAAGEQVTLTIEWTVPGLDAAQTTKVVL